MRTVERIRRRSRSLDEPLVNSGIPMGRLGNRTFPTASEARQAAIVEANRLNQTVSPGHSIARSDAHRPGELPHYHVIDPQGNQISGHFFYGRNPYRVKPSRDGNLQQSIAAATRDLNPRLLSWQEEYQRLKERIKNGQANRQEKGRFKWLSRKLQSLAQQRRTAHQLGVEIHASRQSKQKFQREQEGEINQQSQWLFEAPFVLERERYINPYSNSEYYSSSEWEAKEKTPKQKPCKQIWTVWGFKKSSATLLGYQKQHIKDILKRIVGLIKSDLKGKDKNAYAVVQILLEGHVDRKTELNDGKLDMARVLEVQDELDKQLLSSDGLQGSVYGFDFSQAGSSRPYSSDSQKNRRVVICVRWEIKNL